MRVRVRVRVRVSLVEARPAMSAACVHRVARWHRATGGTRRRGTAGEARRGPRSRRSRAQEGGHPQATPSGLGRRAARAQQPQRAAWARVEHVRRCARGGYSLHRGGGYCCTERRLRGGNYGT